MEFHSYFRHHKKCLLDISSLPPKNKSNFICEKQKIHDYSPQKVSLEIDHQSILNDCATKTEDCEILAGEVLDGEVTPVEDSLRKVKAIDKRSSKSFQEVLVTKYKALNLGNMSSFNSQFCLIQSYIDK